MTQPITFIPNVESVTVDEMSTDILIVDNQERPIHVICPFEDEYPMNKVLAYSFLRALRKEFDTLQELVDFLQ